jgi:hypothetical protein
MQLVVRIDVFVIIQRARARMNMRNAHAHLLDGVWPEIDF